MFSLALILITQWRALGVFSLRVATMTHMADVFLSLLAPCNEPLLCVTIYFPCVFLIGIMSDHQFGNQFMCSVVASHVSHLPTTNLSFVWIAPPAGTGCVNFMATATHRGQVIFKDALAQQLCEQGAPTEAPLHPHLAEMHSDSIILRDDFDSYHQQELNPSMWSECSNCEVGEQCGVIMHGSAVTFCEPYGPRELVSEGWLICRGWDCRLRVKAAEMLVCFQNLVFSREALK
uniref:Reelin n=1 Tax=Calidris pygmaea TaxID=425635 RepID=A0A8C3JBP3_9CHAR